MVRAAVEYVLEKSGRPLVADSLAMGSFERILKEVFNPWVRHFFDEQGLTKVYGEDY